MQTLYGPHYFIYLWILNFPFILIKFLLLLEVGTIISNSIEKRLDFQVCKSQALHSALPPTIGNQKRLCLARYTTYKVISLTIVISKLDCLTDSSVFCQCSQGQTRFVDISVPASCS